MWSCKIKNGGLAQKFSLVYCHMYWYSEKLSSSEGQDEQVHHSQREQGNKLSQCYRWETDAYPDIHLPEAVEFTIVSRRLHRAQAEGPGSDSAGGYRSMGQSGAGMWQQ